MVKTRLAFIALFLLVTLIPTNLISGVKAQHVSVAWGEETTQTDPYERWQMSYTASYITNLANGWGGWVAADFYGSSTTPYNVYTSNILVGNYPCYDYLATFHVGDMYPAFDRYGHNEVIGWYWDDEMGMWMPITEFVVDGYVRHYAYYSYYGYGYTGIEDSMLSACTSWKNQFTFMWTCTEADWINYRMLKNSNYETYYGDSVDNYYYYDFDYGTGLVGMPAAWADTNMAQNGFSDYPGTGSYCYISFWNTSLGLCDDAEFGGNYNYGDFVRDFYYHALVDHYSIHNSLNYAMQDCGVSNFQSSWLYQGYTDGYGNHCKMNVFGNSYNTLPYY